MVVIIPEGLSKQHSGASCNLDRWPFPLSDMRTSSFRKSDQLKNTFSNSSMKNEYSENKHMQCSERWSHTSCEKASRKGE